MLHGIDDNGRAITPPEKPVADEVWRVLAKETGEFRTLKMNLPAGGFCVGVFRSEHYGLLASIVVKSDFWDQTTELPAYQVDFSKPLAELMSSTATRTQAARTGP
jgi:hypothetical protein